MKLFELKNLLKANTHYSEDEINKILQGVAPDNIDTILNYWPDEYTRSISWNIYALDVLKNPSKFGLSVLNVGAGLLPMVNDDLKVLSLYNFDPLDAAKEKIDSKMFGFFLGLINDSKSGIKYATDSKVIKTDINNGSIDLLIGVSPYGFSLINGLTNSKLKSGSHVFILGNGRNGWIGADKNQKGECLFESDQLKTQFGVLDPGSIQSKLLLEIKGKLETLNSLTSAAEKETKLDTFVVLKKK